MGCNLDLDGRAAMKEIGMPRESLLAQTLVDLADSLVDDFDVVELLTLLTDRCVEVLSVAAAGIMLPIRARKSRARSFCFAENFSSGA